MVDKKQTATDAPIEERLLDDSFILAATLKGINGLLEIAGAVVTAFIPASAVLRIVTSIERHVGLTHAWHNYIANYLDRLSTQFMNGRPVFVLVYLALHGLIKLFVAYALLRRRYRLFPVAIAILLAFVAYQLIEAYLRGSIGLVLLSLFDIVVAWLTYLEYRRHQGAS